MRVIISGPVTQAHIEDADLMAGIVPTSYVTNGLSAPPTTNMLVATYPLCQMQPDYSRELARNYTLVHNADALICVGENNHLVELAKRGGLAVYEVSA